MGRAEIWQNGKRQEKTFDISSTQVKIQTSETQRTEVAPFALDGNFTNLQQKHIHTNTQFWLGRGRP